MSMKQGVDVPVLNNVSSVRFNFHPRKYLRGNSYIFCFSSPPNLTCNLCSWEKKAEGIPFLTSQKLFICTEYFNNNDIQVKDLL